MRRRHPSAAAVVGHRPIHAQRTVAPPRRRSAGSAAALRARSPAATATGRCATATRRSITRQVRARGVEECFGYRQAAATSSTTRSTKLRHRLAAPQLERATDEPTRVSLQSSSTRRSAHPHHARRHRSTAAAPHHPHGRAGRPGRRGQRRLRHHRRARQRRRRRRHPTGGVAPCRRRRQRPTTRQHRTASPPRREQPAEVQPRGRLRHRDLTASPACRGSRCFGYVLGQGPRSTDAYNQANGSPEPDLRAGARRRAVAPRWCRCSPACTTTTTTRRRRPSCSVALVVACGDHGRRRGRRTVDLPPLLADSPRPTSTPSQYREVGTLLAALFLLQIFFYGLNALFGAAAATPVGRFFAAAWAPALSNVVIIGYAAVWCRSTVTAPQPELRRRAHQHALRWTLGLGATVGIAVMALALLPALARARLRLRLHGRLPPPCGAVAASLSAAGRSGYVVANQVAILVVQNLLFAVGGGNQTSYINGFTFFVLPHGLLGVSIATTFLPEMSSAISASETEQRLVEPIVSLGIRLVALLTHPRRLRVVRAAPGRSSASRCSTASSDAARALTRQPRARRVRSRPRSASRSTCSCCESFYAHQDARTPFVINLGREPAQHRARAACSYRPLGMLGIGLRVRDCLRGGCAVVAAGAVATRFAAFELKPTCSPALTRMVLASVVMAEAVWAGRPLGRRQHRRWRGAAGRGRRRSSAWASTSVMLAAAAAPELDELRGQLRSAATRRRRASKLVAMFKALQEVVEVSRREVQQRLRQERRPGGAARAGADARHRTSIGG